VGVRSARLTFRAVNSRPGNPAGPFNDETAVPNYVSGRRSMFQFTGAITQSA
jgi:hypothetical protein